MAAQIGNTVIIVDCLVFTQFLKGTQSVFYDVDRQIESVSEFIE